MLQDIDAYLSFYSLDGFFIDEMANDNSNLTITYYQSIYQHIKNLSNDYSVNVNPGANVPENFVSIPLADTFVLFENSAQQYARWFEFFNANFDHLQIKTAEKFPIHKGNFKREPFENIF